MILKVHLPCSQSVPHHATWKEDCQALINGAHVERSIQLLISTRGHWADPLQNPDLRDFKRAVGQVRSCGEFDLDAATKSVGQSLAIPAHYRKSLNAQCNERI